MTYLVVKSGFILINRNYQFFNQKLSQEREREKLELKNKTYFWNYKSFPKKVTFVVEEQDRESTTMDST